MPPKTYPYATLIVLTLLNTLNYIDRNMLLGVQPLVQGEFRINDAQLGLLTSAFFFCYMFAAPVVGWMGDRFPRKNLILVGIAVWSGFTLLTWLVRDYQQLLLRHTVVGIGEASYATIAPTLVADLFPVERRGRMLSIFYLGLPVGSALGILLGGPLGQQFGWRVPFMLAGIPGFLLALIFWFLPEPVRGQTEAVEHSQERSTLLGLLRNGAFITACLGMAMYTFAVGGLQVWIPTFLHRVRGMSVSKAAIVFAVFTLLINTGPSNTAVVNSVGPGIRSTSLAVNTFVIHALGDAFSPYMIGWISDRTSLQTAFWAAFVAAAISGGIFLYGARFAPKLQAATNAAAT